MSRLLHMDWPSRLAWGLLAWPVMVSFAVLLSSAADPDAVHSPWVIAAVSVGEVLAAAVAIVFPIWALLTWAQSGDEPGGASTSHPQ